MTPQIKNRIEQIRRGEVPEGYKRTRAGIMPQDWICKKEYQAKEVFQSISNKKHNGDLEILSATQDMGVIPRSKLTIDIKWNEENTSGYKKVEKGDFVISLRSFQGGIEYSEYDGLVSPAYTVLKPTIPVCNEYYKEYFKTSDYISRLNKGTYGIRDGKQIGFEDFGNMVIHYPPLAEQKKIAEILTAQDRVIALLDQKIEQLQKMKKVFLQKMFPAKGQTVPEWRFEGFSGDWEQRKLIELYISACSGGTPTSTNKEYYNGSIPFLGISDIEQRIISHTQKSITEDGLKNSTALIIPVGSISLAMYASVGRVGIIGIPLATSQAFFNMTFDNDEVRDFVFTRLQKAEMFSEWEPLISTGTQRNLNAEKVKNWMVMTPSKIEQKQIGAFFKIFDNLITLHQRKRDEEKRKKKALMQLLLTGIVRTKEETNRA